jgi:homopolymeric O-antigen transport system permease protein
VLRFAAVTARSDAPSSLRSSSVRPGPIDLVRIGFTDVLSRRRLISYLVRADLKKTGSDTLLGNIWWVVDPLLQMMVYVIFMGIILQRRTPDFPLFVFAAILPWKWFNSTVQDGIQSVVGREKLIKQIYFPKIVLPFSTVVAGVVNFAFGLIPLVGLMLLAYADRISAWLLLIPVVAVVQLVLSFGTATLLGAANVFYRDVANLARHLIRMWFYLSPVLWGQEDITRFTREYPWLGTLIKLNPFYHLLNSYRDLIYYDRAPDWHGLFWVLVFGLVLLVLSVWAFKRLEPSFAKVL